VRKIAYVCVLGQGECAARVSGQTRKAGKVPEPKNCPIGGQRKTDKEGVGTTRGTQARSDMGETFVNHKPRRNVVGSTCQKRNGILQTKRDGRVIDRESRETDNRKYGTNQKPPPGFRERDSAATRPQSEEAQKKDRETFNYPAQGYGVGQGGA